MGITPKLPANATQKQRQVFNQRPPASVKKAPEPPPNWKYIADNLIAWPLGEGEKASYAAFVNVGGRYWWKEAESTYHQAIAKGLPVATAKRAARFVLDNGPWARTYLNACWAVGLKVP